MKKKLEIKNLSNAQLDPVNLQLAEGECLGLFGPSGAGKTRFLRAVADLDLNQGEVYLDGEARSEIPPPDWRRRVAYLPADNHWWERTVGQHASHWDLKLLEKLGFGPQTLDWEVARLSSGERQRLGLARALTNHPEVLLLDEPTANLDSKNTHRVEALVADYRRAYSASVIWVSHDATQRHRVAQSEAMIAQKRITLGTESPWN